MDGEGGNIIKKKLSQYGGLLSLVTAVVNIAFGVFLVLSFYRSSSAALCSNSLPLFVVVAGITCLCYGGLFAIYALVACARFIRRSQYKELVSESDVEAPSLAAAAAPKPFFALTGLFLVLVSLFRLSWLIFGTVEVFNASGCDDGLMRAGFIFVITEWSIIGGIILLACIGLWSLICCAVMLGSG